MRSLTLVSLLLFASTSAFAQSDPAYRQMYGYALVATGLGSYFYHASLTFAGQVADMTGMYLVITFALLYCTGRMNPAATCFEIKQSASRCFAAGCTCCF